MVSMCIEKTIYQQNKNAEWREYLSKPIHDAILMCIMFLQSVSISISMLLWCWMILLLNSLLERSESWRNLVGSLELGAMSQSFGKALFSSQKISRFFVTSNLTAYK